MTQRTRISRKLRRTSPRVQRSSAATATAGRGAARREQGPAGGLMIGGAHDPAEKAADRAADRVMRMPDVPRSVRRECAECAEGEKGREMRKKAAPGAGPAAPGAASAPASAGQAKAIGSLGAGRPLASAERAFFEPRFGSDLSPVRVHDGAAADRANKAVGARAFSLGNDVAFARGEYAPGTDSGRRLMAHELAHVVEEGPARRSVRRSPPEPAAADPLCRSYDFFIDKLILENDVKRLAAGGGSENRLGVIQRLKIFHRCASGTEVAEIRAYLAEKLGVAIADEVWKSAGTAFGGYRGVYPGYYSGAKWLSGLGTSEVEGSATFSYGESSDAAVFDPRAKAAASAMAGTIEHTDILYFYGHQYAQYGAPGVFANGTQSRFVDLRKLAAKGDFSRVKLIVSTSCATICMEALEVFASLFPNAVILGYRKSAPIDGGAVRSSFDKGIKSLKKPLLLDQPVDVSAIIEVWKSVVKSHHPREAERLPGYYKDGTVHYLEQGSWSSVPGTDAANTCKKKGTQIEQAR